MKPIFWVIAVVVLQAIVAALAKKAQANQQAARAAKAAASETPTATPQKPAFKGPQQPKRFTKPAAQRPKGGAASAKVGSTKPGSLGAQRPQPPAAPRATAASDSDAAMQSRQHLADSLARLQAAEAKIRSAGAGSHRPAGGGAGTPPPTAKSSKAGSAVGAAHALRSLLRNPTRTREAFLISEVMGRPKSDQV